MDQDDSQIDKVKLKRNENNRCCSSVCFIEKKDGIEKLALKEVSEQSNLFTQLTGTPNIDLASSIISAGVEAMPPNMKAEEKYNLILQNLADSAPQDAHEARLTTQAVVLYNQGMSFLERARRVMSDDTFAKDHWHIIFMRSATKLLDMHIKVVDALTRYRHKGEQKIVVQHVNVENGGKAIVGMVNPGASSK